jgi:hypothetical protein
MRAQHAPAVTSNSSVSAGCKTQQLGKKTLKTIKVSFKIKSL